MEWNRDRCGGMEQGYVLCNGIGTYIYDGME